MSRTVVFVHGVGVRGTAYAETYRAVKDGFTRTSPEVAVRGCYWGDAEGARLHAGGASIPGYHQSRGQDPDPQEEELALWAVLYTDPWYELRLLRHAGWFEPADQPPGRPSPRQELLNQIRSFTPSPELRQSLAGHDLEHFFDAALADLHAAPEFQQIPPVGNQGALELRRAIARGLLAHAIAAAEQTSGIAVDGTTRDALLLHLGTELRTFGRGLPRALTALPSRALSWAVIRRRGLLSDRSMAASGDVLRYQAHGEGLRQLLRKVIDDAPGERITVVGHSLGGVAAFDLLAREELPRVDRLVTVGSQAPYLYEIGALVSLSYPQPLPLHFPDTWLNIFDSNDLLSYVGQRLFSDRVQDRRVDNGQPFPQSHSAYWANDDFWKVVAPWAQ